MDSIPLVRKLALAPAISFLSAEKVPVYRHLRRARLSVPTPETLETLIPLHQACVFLSSVARAEGLHGLGFHIAGHLGIESLGPYGRLVAKAFTFHEAIQITRELISTYNSGLKIWMERHGDQVRYCQKYVGNLPQDGITEIVHLGLANTLALAGVQRGTGFQPTRIELATGPVDLGVYFPELGDLPISFDQPQTSLWFNRTWLSKPLPTFRFSQCPPASDDERASLVTTGPSTEPIKQLEQVIETVLDHSMLGLPLTASVIGMSTRTLQRRLAEHGTSFSRLLQDVRFRNAQRFLCHSDMPLKEIAKWLGYTELANFIRAFKRWTGVGPNEFRRLYGESERNGVLPGSWVCLCAVPNDCERRAEGHGDSM